MKFFLLSKKVYNLPQLDSYQKQKKECLNQYFNNYDGFSIPQRWNILIEGFCQNIQNQHLPSPHFVNELHEFKNRRQDSIANIFNLSLEQCLKYFEDFFFLYVNDDVFYQLNSESKKKLLFSIKQAFQVCETGINGRFYTALQDYQKEHNWIVNILVKSRCNIIHMLQAKYESQHRILNGMSVHVYDYFIKLANQKGFGIPVYEDIVDLYAGNFNKIQLENFFEQEYPEKVKQYQNEIPLYLLQDLIEGLIEIISIENKTWDAEFEVHLPACFISNLTEFLSGRFQVSSQRIAQLADTLCRMNEDYTALILKDKNTVQLHLKKFLIEFLIENQYFLSIENIKNNSELNSQVILPPDTNVQDIVELYDALKNFDETVIKKLALKNGQFFELIIESMINHPSIYKFIPYYLKNDARFINASIEQMEVALILAIDEGDNCRIMGLLDLMQELISGEIAYLIHVDYRIFQHPEFTKRFHDSFHNNESIISILLDKQRISSFELMHALNFLSLQDLLQINNERLSLRKTAIPFVQQNKPHIENFLNEIKTLIPQAENIDTLSLKRMACEMENFKFAHQYFYNKTAVTFLAKNKNIYAAFIEYQNYQISLEKMIYLLSSFGYHLIQLGLNFLEALIYLLLIIYIILTIVFIMRYHFFYVLVLILVCYGLADLLNNSFLETVCEFFCRLFALDIELFGSLFSRFFLVAFNRGLQDLSQVIMHVIEMVNILFLYMNTSDVLKANNLQDACENTILRLEMKDEPSASQKASVLRDLYQKMNNDEGGILSNLDKPYLIEFQKKEYYLSFKQASSISRQSTNEWSIHKPGLVTGLFRSTTSSRIISKSLDYVIS